jgi:aminoglycoside phosphotransferase (APT) family kinase protein
MFVERRREALSACERPVLCHNDLNEGNVFVAEPGGSWEVTGIIDVEDAISGDPMVDLARIHHLAAGRDNRRWMAFLTGYGALPPEWADRFAVYRLLHAVDLWCSFRKLGWRTLLPAIERDIVERCGCPPGRSQPCEV